MDIGVMMAVTEATGDIAEMAREVEKLGFESLFVPEHPVIPVGFKTAPPGGGILPEHYGRWMDPFVVLSVAAAVTNRIRLGTGICLLPEREPIITAKVIATLDVISRGRVVLGVGAGWLKEETEALGTKFGLRWKRLRETVEALRILWTQPEPSYDGELVKFPPLRCDPKPVQKGGPPILLGAHGPRGRERVVRSFDGWCPVVPRIETFQRSVAELKNLAFDRGRSPESLQITAFVTPHYDGLSRDELKYLRDAGANRIVLFAQSDATERADAKTLQNLRRIAPTLDRAQSI
jgi:probable F420-dependent oxidoreductase